MIRNRFSHHFAVAAILLATCGGAKAAEVAVAAPFEGPYAAWSQALLSGVRSLLPDAAFIVVGCDEGTEVTLGDPLPEIIIGPPCLDGLSAISAAIGSRPTIVIAAGLRTATGQDETARRFLLLPDDETVAAATAAALFARWSGKPYAVVDDGSLQGRLMAEAIRAEGERKGHAPALFEPMRPQAETHATLVARIIRSAAEAVFVGAERQDAAVLARELLARAPSVEIIGAESLLAAPTEPDLPAGVLMAAPAIDGELPMPEALGRAAAQIAAEVLAGGNLPPGTPAADIRMWAWNGNGFAADGAGSR